VVLLQQIGLVIVGENEGCNLGFMTQIVRWS